MSFNDTFNIFGSNLDKEQEAEIKKTQKLISDEAEDEPVILINEEKITINEALNLTKDLSLKQINLGEKFVLGIEKDSNQNEYLFLKKRHFGNLHTIFTLSMN